MNLLTDPTIACGSCYRESSLRNLPSLGKVISRKALIQMSDRRNGESTPSECLSDDTSSSSSSSAND